MTSHIEELNAPYVKRNFIKQCPVCGSNQLRLFMRTEDYSYSHDEYDLIRCQNCQLILTQNPPVEEWIGHYYQSENYISHTDTRKGLTSRLYHIARQWMLGRKFALIRNKSKGTGKRLLDIGAGTGYFADFARQRGWEVTGIEASPDARQTALEKFDLALQPAGSLFSQTGSYDAITLWHVLEHLHALNESLAQIHKLLAPEGKLLIAVPNHGSWDAGWYGKFWAAWDVPRHLWHFAPSTMEQLLQNHGFSVKRKKAMPLDAIYVCLLSEKYRGKKLGFVRGLIKGSWAAFWSLFFRKRCSSVIYIAQHA